MCSNGSETRVAAVCHCGAREIVLIDDSMDRSRINSRSACGTAETRAKNMSWYCGVPPFLMLHTDRIAQHIY